MNELAQIVYDLVTGKEIGTDRFAGLSPEERATLEDLDSLQSCPTGGVTGPCDRLTAYDWVSPPPIITSMRP